MALLPTDVREAQKGRGKMKPIHFKLFVRNEEGHHWMSDSAGKTVKDDPSDCQENSTVCK